ncbi:enoyl-CoA hydratase-related protein [Pseudomonas kitaguniensis]|uniref:enoyl-CoA hydratase-related protein n=1 Tax=Pseudomonas kitaguniensis TaxID=2607908 RepID=UPI003CFC2531
MSLVSYERLGAVAIFQLNNPPLNAFNETLLDDFSQVLERYNQDPQALIAIVCGQGDDFSIGALKSELGVVYNSDAARPLIEAVEVSSKPLVAVLHGRVFGAALELVLACQWRLATADALVGAPDIHIGLPPGAGATQRLPRLIGVAPAFELLMSADPINADRALELGLVDGLLDRTWQERPEEILAWTAAHPNPVPCRYRESLQAHTPVDYLKDFKARQTPDFFAYKGKTAILQLLETALCGDFDSGYALEADLYVDAEQSGQSMALMGAFDNADAAAWGPLYQPDAEPIELNGITLTGEKLPLGCRLDSPGPLRFWVQQVAESDPVLVNLSASDVWLDFSTDSQPCRLKRYAELAGQMRKGGVIVYGVRDGQTVDMDTLPEQIEGHPLLAAFSYGEGPLSLLQFVKRETDHLDSVRMAVKGASAMGYACLHSTGTTPLGKVLIDRWAADLKSLWAAGVSHDDTVRVANNFGLPLPPVEWLAKSSIKDVSTVPMLDDESLLRAVLASMANQGCRLLDEGLAMHPDDIDMIFTRGYGYPPYQFGPMAHWSADVVLLHDSLLAFAEQFGPTWEPASMLKRMAAEQR